jgi:hypothetical protein
VLSNHWDEAASRLFFERGAARLRPTVTVTYTVARPRFVGKAAHRSRLTA